MDNEESRRSGNVGALAEKHPTTCKQGLYLTYHLLADTGMGMTLQNYGTSDGTDMDTQHDTAPPPQDLFRFSVVTAAYNASPWIERMLASLVQQQLPFERTIQVIIVDDGSTDQTAEVVQQWVDRFPRNILLIRQENGGPAAARNRGLVEASGEWVSFIDADDFVATDYFPAIENFLEQSAFDGHVMACKTLQYFDPGDVIVDGHALTYKFEETKVVDLMEEPTYIQLFINACVFRRSSLVQYGARFDERVQPSFEDAHFLNLFLLQTGDFRIAFLKDAHYLYRRRGTGTGLVDGGWAKPAKYRDQILFGYLDLVQQYQRGMGSVPDFIQNLVLYECHWYMQKMLENDLPISLSNTQLDEFFHLGSLVFRHVSVHQILLSSLPALDLRTRITMLRVFKQVSFANLPLICKEVAPDGTEMELLHWTTDPATYSLHAESGQLSFRWEKHIPYEYGNKVLMYEHRLWAQLSEADPIWPEVNGERPGVLSGELLFDSLTKSTVHQSFYLPESMLSQQQRECLEAANAPEGKQYQSGWVLMDRADKADDNAEHMYRWLMEHHPEQMAHFVLDVRSKDWSRLEQEGFRLLPYGSPAHFQALAKAEWLVSSHADVHIVDPMQTKNQFGVPPYNVAFLQHGISMGNLYRWLNNLKLNMIVTSTKLEYESFTKGRYKFTEREIVLSGLPRHDAMLKKSQTRKRGRTILLCPTWRESIFRQAAALGRAEGLELVRQSDFFKAWNGVISSHSVAQLLREQGYRLLFLPHPETGPYMPLFEGSEVCKLLQWSDVKSIQDLLVRSALVVTDYSSLVFDVAYVDIPIAYYHFHESPSYFTLQGRDKGYYDHETRGLGPVLPTQEALEEWIEDMLQNGCRPQALYQQRAAEFYSLRDGQNCRRVYEAILERSPRAMQ